MSPPIQWSQSTSATLRDELARDRGAERRWCDELARLAARMHAAEHALVIDVLRALSEDARLPTA